MLSLKNDHPALVMFFYKLFELEGHHLNVVLLVTRGLIYKVCVRLNTRQRSFIKTVFHVEKCFALSQGLSRRTHFLLSEYCRFL